MILARRMRVEPLRDLTWIKYLLRGPPVERLERKGYTVSLVSVPRTTERHNERYRYRAFVFEASGKIPVLAVNLESDILGEYMLTVEDARERQVRTRYDGEPSFEEFRAKALEEADHRFKAHPPVKRPATSRQISRN